MFNRKFSSNIRKKKRMITSAIILLVVFLSVGYSVFSTNLAIDGTLNVSKYDRTLYKVLKDAANEGTYAKEYTGNHQDTMAGVGSEKIYHWWADNNTNGTAILDKNNVIFADHCWQMIRTTDTGGVKMIYNGEPENNQCLNTRGNHVGYKQWTWQSMSTTYYYGTSYTYDKTNNVFSLDGTVTTGTIQTGQYTCRSTSSTGTCATLYFVNEQFYNTTYNVLTLDSNSQYAQFGKLGYNKYSNSPAYVGYMYNTDSSSMILSNYYYVTNYSPVTIDTNYYYSDTIDYNTTTPNEYTLNNPIQISTLSDYTTLVGKYILNTTNMHSTTASYVTAVSGNQLYFKELTNGDLNTSLTLGDSYTKSGNTYTLTNPTNVTYIDWYSNTSDYSIYKDKYVCDGNNTSCTNLRHITSNGDPSKNFFLYFDTNNTYSYAEDVSYNGGTYTLTGDIKTFWDLSDSTNQGYLPTHHYTCLENGTSCTTIGYVITCSGHMVYYALFSGYSNVSTAINDMLSADGVNQNNSIIKAGVDAWYKRYLTNYTSKLEDTIYCNDRSITSIGAWDPNGGDVRYYSTLKFKNHDTYNHYKDLSCTNITDKFSMSNTKAQLIYPIGLLTAPEISLLNNTKISATGQSYFLISPNRVSDNTSFISDVSPSGNVSAPDTDDTYGVRPVVSLTPGTEYTSGNGSMSDPYVVE